MIIIEYSYPEQLIETNYLLSKNRMMFETRLACHRKTKQKQKAFNHWSLLDIT